LSCKKRESLTSGGDVLLERRYRPRELDALELRSPLSGHPEEVENGRGQIFDANIQGDAFPSRRRIAYGIK
jgi:hypothetical protein